jgi:N utilization substance protein A
MLVKLGNAGIKNINDLADLASDELKEILDGIDIPNKDADEIIMRARAGWFEEDSESNKKEDTEVK